MNNLLIIDTNNANMENIIRYISDNEFHNFVNTERKKYLLGLTPIYQNLNNINSGISIDSFNNVIFHDKKINNYAYRYADIKNYELLEDNTFILRKKDDGTKQYPEKNPTKCNLLTLKITLINDQTFSINLLEPNTFNKAYSQTDKKYLEQVDFGTKIIERLDSLLRN